MIADSALGQAKRAGAEGAGLVPYKTTRQSVIDLSKENVAVRRIKRLKRSVWASGHLHGLAQKGSRALQPWFVTLTYVATPDWRPCHVAGALRLFRSWCVSKGVPCRYTWVAELQSRGAVHYHLLAWLPVGVRMPHWDRPTVKRGGLRPSFWPHGMTNTQPALAGVGYLMKYLSKLGELTKFPRGLRLYGIGGLDQAARNVRSWLNLPGWCKPLFGVGELVRKSGALVVRSTGEILEAAFKAVHIPGGLHIVALRELPPVAPEFERCGAYSSVRFA